MNIMEKWKKIFKFNSDICQIFQTNNSFGIICHDSIQFYKSNTQQFNPKISLKKNIIPTGCYGSACEQDSGHIILFDDINNILYYKDPSVIRSKEWMIINMKTMEITKMHNGTDQTNLAAKGIIINNKLHLIGGSLGIHHCYDPLSKQYTKVTDFIIPSHGVKGEKHEILVASSNGDKIYFFGVDYEVEPKDMLKVLQYNVRDNKWHDLTSINFPELIGDFGVVCVKNDRYLIIFGGIDRDIGDNGLRKRNDIFIMDIELRKFGKCMIKCPVRGSVKVATNNDKHQQELMVSGYTRYLCKNGELDDKRVPPIYLQRLIGSYIECEMIYVFWKYLGWTISVDTLINNTHFN